MSPTKPDKKTITSKNIETYVDIMEALRTRLVDLDALANAAEQLLGELPFLSTQDDSARRNYGRLHSLTNATAEAARSILDECEESLARIYEPDDGDDGEEPGGNGEGDDSDDDGDDSDDSNDSDEPGSGSQDTGDGGASGVPTAHIRERDDSPPRASKGGILLDYADAPRHDLKPELITRPPVSCSIKGDTSTPGNAMGGVH